MKTCAVKILSALQIREGDAYTIAHEPISSVDLMERAGEKCFQWIYGHAPQLFPEQLDEGKYTFNVFCGVGNNGGDGLVIARLLNRNGYDVKVYIVDFSKNESDDFKTNFQRIGKRKLTVNRITTAADIPDISADSLVIDALIGTGIGRPVEGITAEVIQKINAAGATVISIDMPSGLFDADNSGNIRSNIVKATYTLTFQFLKPSFLLAENASFVGQCEVVDIELHPHFIESVETDYLLVTSQLVTSIYQRRQKFSHKGTFGHAAIIAGSKGKVGAAVLAARGALHAGAGLVTAVLPSSGTTIMHISVPEAMAHETGDDFLAGEIDVSAYSAIGIGPGIGLDKETQLVVRQMVTAVDIPTVIDADAINILSVNKDWYENLHAKVILTPHPGEFKRMAGEWSTDFEKLSIQIKWAKDHKCYVLLKGAYSSLATPEGKVYFNSTGNPGMATGGSGDVLTGIITGLLAQGYPIHDAAILGMYLHGKAGDLAVIDCGEEALTASLLWQYLGKAFLSLNLR